jgi:hypothetical protein
LRGATVWLTRRLDQPPTPSRASMGMLELLASSCTIKGAVSLFKVCKSALIVIKVFE